MIDRNRGMALFLYLLWLTSMSIQNIVSNTASISNESMMEMIQQLLANQTAMQDKINEMATKLEDREGEIEKLSINPNFGCLVRGAMQMRIEKLVANSKERFAVIALDIAGMGLANSREGEAWVNKQISSAIRWLQEHLRSTDAICGQLNSGDELLIVCLLKDAEGLAEKVKYAFDLFHLNPGTGKDSAYVAWVEYYESLPFTPPLDEPEANANSTRAMAEVYKLKEIAKAQTKAKPEVKQSLTEYIGARCWDSGLSLSVHDVYLDKENRTSYYICEKEAYSWVVMKQQSVRETPKEIHNAMSRDRLLGWMSAMRGSSAFTYTAM